MTRARRTAAVALVAVLAAWLAALLVLDVVLAPREARGTERRLAESLHGSASVGDVHVSLVRGALELETFAVRRDDAIGHLALDVRSVRCELAPLGLALVDRGCRSLDLRGIRLEVTAAALLQIEHPQHAPPHAHRVVIDDAELRFSPSAFASELGAIRIAIDHAEAGDTVLRTPLSWLFAVDQLDARLELPAGITLGVSYARGVLAVAGALFGSDPVELAVDLPSASGARDGKAELALLVEVGTQIAERVVAKRAADWLRSALH
jgi:hypothetical protein